jgi:hypothetical protein
VSGPPRSLTLLPDGVSRLGSAEVSAAPVRHRGPTIGYRIEEGGRSLVYIPDHEPYACTRAETGSDLRVEFVSRWLG